LADARSRPVRSSGHSNSSIAASRVRVLTLSV
jgi:hypothetical protein